MTKRPRHTPDATLLLTSSCPFCPTVLKALSELVKSGAIGRLEVINLERHPEAARTYGTRSVPWVRLGPFELDGLRSEAELKVWAERAGTTEGMAAYVNELLATGALKKAIEQVRTGARGVEALAFLAADPGTDLQVRVGIAAVLEEMSGDPALAPLVEPLVRLTQHAEARLRSDACHYLALTRDARAIPAVERLLADPDATVRELAAESLTALRAGRA